MATKNLNIALAAACFARLVSCQIASTLPLQLTAPTGAPTSTTGTNITNYPTCAQICGQPQPQGTGLPPICPDQTDVACQCGVNNRGNASACQAATCNDADYLKSATLAIDLCGSLYEADAALSASVSSAIVSATSLALGALATANPKVLSDYPACAQKCIPPALAVSGCKGLDDVECICRCPTFNSAVGPCEIQTCTFQDIQTIEYLAYALCVPVDGLVPKLLSACGIVSGNSTGTGALPTGTGIATGSSPSGPTLTGPAIVPFEGLGAVVRVEMARIWAGVALLFGIGAAVVAW